MAKLTAAEYQAIQKAEWFTQVSTEEGAAVHAQNVQNWRDAQAYHDKADRPLEVLVVHGSGRNTQGSCAREISNSQALLMTGIQVLENMPAVNIREIHLRDLALDPCNGCLSTSSAWCHAPCDCFPLDGMHEVFPAALRADVMLWSTGVNQSAMSTRLKLAVDRMICMDGGLFQPVFEDKTEEFKQRCIALEESGEFAYTPRLYGRVCAYFISSKDEENMMPDMYGPEWPGENPHYVLPVAMSLAKGFGDYGCFHADFIDRPWYARVAGNPHEAYSRDKLKLHRDRGAQEQAHEVVRAAVYLAQGFRDGSIPQPPMPVDRINRT